MQPANHTNLVGVVMVGVGLWLVAMGYWTWGAPMPMAVGAALTATGTVLGTARNDALAELPRGMQIVPGLGALLLALSYVFVR